MLSQAGSQFRVDMLAGCGIEITLLALEWLIRTGEALPSEECGEEAILGCAPNLEALAHGAEHYLQSGSLGGRDTKRPYHLLRAQAQHFAACGRGAEDSARSRDMPAQFVVRRIDGISQSAFDFSTQDKGVDKLGTSDGMIGGQREQRGRYGAGGVNDRLQVGVVIIEYVRTHTVEECAAEWIDAFVPSEDTSDRRPGVKEDSAHGVVDRVLMGTSDGNANPVHDGAHGLFPDRLRDSSGL